MNEVSHTILVSLYSFLFSRNTILATVGVLLFFLSLRLSLSVFGLSPSL